MNHIDPDRLVADYKGGFVKQEDAQKLVLQAEAFVAAIRTTFTIHN